MCRVGLSQRLGDTLLQAFQNLPSVQLPPHAYGVLHLLAAVAFPSTCDLCLLTTELCLWSSFLPHGLDAL